MSLLAVVTIGPYKSHYNAIIPSRSTKVALLEIANLAQNLICGFFLRAYTSLHEKKTELKFDSHFQMAKLKP